MRKLNFIWIGIITLVGITLLSELFYCRIDTTKDQKYTLTNTSKNIIQSIDNQLKIKILLDGEITGDYRILKNEIKFLLEELRTQNPNITFQFLNPVKDFAPQELEALNLLPVTIKTEKGSLNIYPFAKLEYQVSKNDSVQTKELWFNTLTNEPSIPFNELALASTEKLEYTFLSNIQKITQTNRKNIGLIVHHDELPEQHIRSFGQALSQKYNVNLVLDPITDSTYTLKPKDLNNLLQYDALIVAKPTLPFTEQDKLVIDQYIMNGGKTLWMLETVDAEMDSIFRSDKILAFPRELNLNDFFFAYGLRIYPTVIKDLEGGKIALADGETAGNVNYNYYTWPYFIRAQPAQQHPINQSLNAVKLEFANPIELLDKPNVNPTVLLSSSAKTNFKSPLTRIQLQDIEIANPEEYRAGQIPTAVLLEGNFQSAYANRFERNEFPNFTAQATNGKMIVVSDGDVAKNHLWIGKTMPLGADKYTMRPDNPNQRPIIYDNQSFLLNSLDYLLGENDFLFLKNRQLQIPQISEQKIKTNKTYWQWFNLLLPLLFILIIAILLLNYKKKKFTSELKKSNKPHQTL